jgi:alanyl-tRNA synthetase
MGDAYPELRRDGERITAVLRAEEERFFETIAHGMTLLEGALAAMGQGKVLDGETAFKLHDTFGFPLDLTADVCRERGVAVDEAGFDRAMNRQRDQARAAGKFKMSAALEYSGGATQFHGYEELSRSARVVALYRDGTRVEQLAGGERGVVVLDHTPFYAESGGQVGDRGLLERAGPGAAAAFEVDDTLKIQADVFGHHGVLRAGVLSVGDEVEAAVDTASRQRIMRNHSVTHLMHKALRQVLGSHVQQKGSLVDAERTRFDFSHNAPVTPEQIREVEALVNAEILANTPTQVQVLPYEEAVKGGAMALFGEKYGDSVRVLDIGTSRELCGGTHVTRTGDIGLFKIASESGVAAGIRRVEGITGDNALAYVQQLLQTLNRAAAAARAPVAELPDRIGQLQEQARALERELGQLKARLASSRGNDLAEQAVEVGGIRVLATRLDGADAKALRATMDQLKDKLKSALIVLASVNDGKVQLAAGVTADLSGRLKAGDLVAHVAAQVGGKGGGKPDFAMAGGSDPTGVDNALASVRTWVEQRV